VRALPLHAGRTDRMRQLRPIQCSVQRPVTLVTIFRLRFFASSTVKNRRFTPTKAVDNKKSVDIGKPKSGDDRLSTLKNYRSAKGLCFKCGEKWRPQHKCPPTISLNAMEEV
jgi:hypothetical protein